MIYFVLTYFKEKFLKFDEFLFQLTDLKKKYKSNNS